MQKRSFFPGGVLSKESFLFFQTIESAKRTFAARAGSRKFLENENQNSRKNYGAMFSFQVQGHMQKLSSFKGKTNKWYAMRTRCVSIFGVTWSMY